MNAHDDAADKPRTTLAEFIEANGISAKITRVDTRPNDMDWQPDARHFRCRLKSTIFGSKPFTLYFSQGPAHTQDPTVADLLDCCASDTAGYENASGFDAWCSEYGYDTDSRKAHKTYRQVERQANALRALLPGDAFETLLWHTERA